MFCRKCGAKLIDDSLFCPKCGTKVEETGVAEDEPSKEKPSPAPEPEKKKEEDESTSAESESSPLMFSPDDFQSGESTSTAAPPQSSEKESPPPPKEEQSKPKPVEEKPKEPEKEKLPEEILPKPDGLARSVELEQVEQEKALLARQLRREQKRWHPLDAYHPIRERLRLKGCGLLIFLFFVVPVLTLGILGWVQHNQFVGQEGFVSVQQMDANIVEAPDEDTFYWHWHLWKSVLYEADETEAEIAIVGGTWWLDGVFKEKVTFRGYQLFLEEGARFENGLEVTAIRFDPGNAEIEGELTGNIAIQD